LEKNAKVFKTHKQAKYELNKVLKKGKFKNDILKLKKKQF